MGPHPQPVMVAYPPPGYAAPHYYGHHLHTLPPPMYAPPPAWPPPPAGDARAAPRRLGMPLRTINKLGRNLRKGSVSPAGRKKLNRKRPRIMKKRATPAAEPTLADLPLLSGGMPGPLSVQQAPTGWHSVLRDEHRRCFVSLRRKAFPEEVTKEWFDALSTKLLWRRPDSEERGLLPRSAAWLTMSGCSCPYAYGGVKFAPLLMAPWFLEITDRVIEACGITERPNGCNANYYDSGAQTVGWHADNEQLFDAVATDALIISLSLGVTRSFEIICRDDPELLYKIELEAGDLCTMEGLAQKHYRHRVPNEPNVNGARINLTWRWIRKHDTTCPLSSNFCP